MTHLSARALSLLFPSNIVVNARQPDERELNVSQRGSVVSRGSWTRQSLEAVRPIQFRHDRSGPGSPRRFIALRRREILETRGIACRYRSGGGSLCR